MSEDKRKKKKTDAAECCCTETPECKDNASSDDSANTLEEQLLNANKELDDVKDRLLRTAAEFDNFRKRTEREKSASITLGIMMAAERLLPALDTLEIAASAESGDADYKKGVEMTVGVFKTALGSLGIVEIETEGKPFDPDLHNAVAREASDLESGTVIRVLQKGYKLEDRVIRHSMVAVAE